MVDLPMHLVCDCKVLHLKDILSYRQRKQMFDTAQLLMCFIRKTIGRRKIRIQVLFWGGWTNRAICR